uniref:Uncharacterized protein n=1 Tax=Globisporangium ultimum (strain ATCC 200006 / CBS 805.95 / DAOM BR144) TaxID=431595 RepID=K3WXP0_GLOUD
MTLTRRNVAAVGDTKPRSSSLWEDEANEYWKEMEPAKKRSQHPKSIVYMLLLVAVGAGVGVFVLSEGGTIGIAVLRERFLSSDTAATTDATAATTSSSSETSGGSATNPVFTNNPAAVDLLRARCRVRGVQTRWHEETCRKLCVRDPQNSACMNGCSYGSITVTKLTCDQLQVADVSSAGKCPDGVNCKMACKAYDTEKPFPDMRNSCERACATIEPSSCSRILQIYKDLYRGTLQ